MTDADIFNAFFSGLKTGNISHPLFSSELRASIEKTYRSMQQDGLTFIIEPGRVTISEPSPSKVRMTGTFAYGFEKDGRFHVVPGQLNSEQAREPSEDGYFEAHLDESGAVVGIYESLAGNWFGSKPTSKGFFRRLFG